MIKTEVRVLAGYEEIHEKLVTMKQGIEEEIRKQVEEKAKHIDNMLAEITEVVEVEVPDEEIQPESEIVETETF